jgi:dipeptidase E
MEKTIIAIGGGEIRNKTTLEIDRYIAQKAKLHAGDKRANALFIGTASHDSMPYFNSFRKTYTSVFDIKAEVGLMVYGEMSIDKIKDKIENADAIYIGGGDTVYMLSKWAELGVDKLIIDAYNNGKIICGLSAGAICWFTNMYTDFEIMRGESSEYVLKDGLGVLKGAMCPHFNEREQDFTTALKKGVINSAYCVENDCAIEFVDGKFTKVISGGGKAYYVEYDGQEVVKREL